MSLLRLLSFLLFLTLAAPFPASGAPAAENRRQLDELEKRIRETSRDLDKKHAAAKSLEAELAEAEKAELRLEGRIASLEAEAAELREEEEAQVRQIGRLQENVAATEGLVRRRLTALYKTGEAGTLRVLFSEKSPARAAEDYDFLQRIVRRDRELLDTYRRQIAEVEEARRALTELQGKKEAALASLQGEQESLRKAKGHRAELLARTQREEKALGGELASLRERARRLGSLIRQLEAQRARELEAQKRREAEARRRKELQAQRSKQLESKQPPKYTPEVKKELPKAAGTGEFARQRGRLGWPADGPVRVTFGTSRHPELGTLRESQGIEIAVPQGRAVSAVWPGTVIFARPFKGFGNMLIVDHGEGYYSLYAQAASLGRAVGDKVNGGDSLGTSGGEGVYFEIRHHGSPLNPADWLSPR